MSALLPHTRRKQSREHAVVIGGSIAGLVAARVLADHFAAVTLVERDRFPDTPRPRPGTPQARHLHVLWPAGLRALERWFPGLGDEMRAAGAPTVRFPGEVAWLRATGWRGRFDVTQLLTASRGLLDWTIHRRLGEAGRVRTLSGHEVTGLIGDGRQGVVGVRTRRRGERDVEQELRADLVVDAGGRGSCAPRWLTDLGFPAPEETKIDARLGYATRFFAVPPGFTAGWRGLNISTNPRVGRRMGWLYPQEGGRWVVCLGGMTGDHPPTDEAGFLEFAASLRSPVLYEAIRDAEPVTPISGYRRTANHRRHYERMARWPAGFVVIGDAVCAFNPIYAQGMTVAAVSSLTLDRCLRTIEDPARLSRAIQRGVGRDASGAWRLATNEDMRYDGVDGPPLSRVTRMLNRYVAKVDVTANVNEYVCVRLVGVLTMAAPLRSLFRPGVMTRVLLHRPRPQPHEAGGLTWSDDVMTRA